MRNRDSHPNSAYDYGEFQWHYAWTVDVAGRTITHRSGLTFRFSNPPFGNAKPPLGGHCDSLAWYGEVVADTALPLPEHRAIRLCREALQLFGDMARFACQDCPTDTEADNYYMVHNELWEKAHPHGHGMLCLPCLQTRVGRRLTLSDFTSAPINQHQVWAFCSGEKADSQAHRH